VGPGEPLPSFDFQCPFGSLPLAFGTTVETIPGRTPYLFAPQSSAPGPRRSARRRIGLCWAGNPSHQNDHNRSIPLSLFEPLLRLENIEFVSLQERLRPGDDAILNRYPAIDQSIRGVSDLGATASLLDQLDLIVTVDTAVAHLAGAMHRPVWILIGFRPYWVWLLERTGSPWYRSARLFRQSAFADWQSVIESVRSELASPPPPPTKVGVPQAREKD
jgi:hypothetical protein